MVASVVGVRAGRREAAVREVLDAAWALLEREGVAALSLRELARSLGIRSQSLAHYFPSKAALLDTLFRDGFTDLAARLQRVRNHPDPDRALAATVRAIAGYCAANPARYHLMLQRTVPGFTPTVESHAQALAALQVLLDRLTACGVSDPADIDVFRGLVNGLIAEQIANDPGGRRVVGRADHAVRLFLAGQRATAARPTLAPRRTP